MSKKIPDIIHNADIQHGRYSAPNVNHYNQGQLAKLSAESKRVYSKVVTGDRVWAYSFANKAWLLSIVFEIRPTGQLGVYSNIYKTYGSGNRDGKFWTEDYTDKMPDGLPDPRYPLDVVKANKPI